MAPLHPPFFWRSLVASPPNRGSVLIPLHIPPPRPRPQKKRRKHHALFGPAFPPPRLFCLKFRLVQCFKLPSCTSPKPCLRRVNALLLAAVGPQRGAAGCGIPKNGFPNIGGLAEPPSENLGSFYLLVDLAWGASPF